LGAGAKATLTPEVGSAAGQPIEFDAAFDQAHIDELLRRAKGLASGIEKTDIRISVDESGISEILRATVPMLAARSLRAGPVMEIRKKLEM
jgi:hypothetical protein